MSYLVHLFQQIGYMGNVFLMTVSLLGLLISLLTTGYGLITRQIDLWLIGLICTTGIGFLVITSGMAITPLLPGA